MNPCPAVDWHKRLSIIPYHVPTRLILEFHISDASHVTKLTSRTGSFALTSLNDASLRHVSSSSSKVKVGSLAHEVGALVWSGCWSAAV